MKFKLSLLVIMVYFGSCANPVGPTGGPKDITPPVIIKTAVDSLNNKITFFFNENIKIKNSITLNPYKKRIKPSYNKTNKSITISIDSITTSINFNDAISDVNENNTAILPFYLVGQDTLRTQLRVQWEKGQKKTIRVIGVIDSLYYSSRQFSDTFIIEGLPDKNLQLIAFEDANKNNELDSNENVAFINTKPTNNDTNIKLREPLKKEIIYDIIDSSLFIIKGLTRNQINEFHIPILAVNRDTIITQSLDQIISNLPFNYKIRKKSITYDTTEVKKYYSKIIEKDTLFYYKPSIGYQLKNKTVPREFYEVLEEDTFYNKSNPKKLGKITLENELFGNIILKLYQKGVEVETYFVESGTTEIELPVGQYKYILFQDLNNNLTLDSKTDDGSIINEPIFHFWFETSVHHKLENIITVNYQETQEKKDNLPVNISSE